MQDCFRQHPETYGAELEDDEDEVEEELHAREAATAPGDEAPQSTPKTFPEPVKEAEERKEPIPELHRDSSKTTNSELEKSGDEGCELLPKAVHDATK